jgi:phosphopantothenoylcysteine synthetase/decarboxylase
LVGESGDFEQKICYEMTEACKGVDRTKKEKEEMEVNINDKKQKLQTGSAKQDPEQFNVNINEEGAAAKLVDQINMAIKNKKNVGGDSDDEDDDDDEDDEDSDNKIDEDLNEADGEEIENLADHLEDTKTEL